MQQVNRRTARERPANPSPDAPAGFWRRQRCRENFPENASPQALPSFCLEPCQKPRSFRLAKGNCRWPGSARHSLHDLPQGSQAGASRPRPRAPCGGTSPVVSLPTLAPYDSASPSANAVTSPCAMAEHQADEQAMPYAMGRPGPRERLRRKAMVETLAAAGKTQRGTGS